MRPKIFSSFSLCPCPLKYVHGLALLVLMMQAGPALCTIISADRMIPWVPGVTVGVRGGIPQRTNLLDITRFGATVNNGSVSGSISGGNNLLTVSSVGDFAVGQGVWVSNVCYSVITNITGNTFMLRDSAFASASGVPVKHDNAPCINDAISAAAKNDVVFIPNGTYVCRCLIYLQAKNYISLRGDTNSVLAMVGYGSLSAGPTSLQSVQAKQFYVGAGGPLKGATQLLVTTNWYAPAMDGIRAGETYALSTRNGNDDNLHVISVYGMDRCLAQTILIESVAGNTITFSPPLVWNFTNAPYLIQSTMQVGRGVGLENFSITTTNLGEVGTAGDTILFQDLADSWITNVTSQYANNYNMDIQGCVFCTVGGSMLQRQVSVGTSHAGMLVSRISGCLIENNIFDGTDFSLQFFGGCQGNAFFGNFFTNENNQAIIFHNTHEMMNLFEGNVLHQQFELDGYYGSNSHETVFRNYHYGNFKINRFSTYMNIVGNVIGTTNVSLCYGAFDETSRCHTPIFQMGCPNIGNDGSTGTSPSLGWNYPQASFWGNHGMGSYIYRPYTNCSYTFTSDLVNVTNFVGDFSNWPYDPYGGYRLVFQDGVNTNVFHGLMDSVSPDVAVSTALMASAPPTAMNMQLNHAVTISNGWTMFVASADTYQQLQLGDAATHILHGNMVYTNQQPAAMVWASNITDTNIPISLAYASGAPSWWGTNAWPAVDPLRTVMVAPIPAQLRYLGISSGTTNRSARLNAPSGLHVIAVSGN
jgi:hypothetical protein